MPGQLCSTGGGIRRPGGAGGVLVPPGGKGSCGCGLQLYRCSDGGKTHYFINPSGTPPAYVKYNSICYAVMPMVDATTLITGWTTATNCTACTPVICTSSGYFPCGQTVEKYTYHGDTTADAEVWAYADNNYWYAKAVAMSMVRSSADDGSCGVFQGACEIDEHFFSGGVAQPVIRHTVNCSMQLYIPGCLPAFTTSDTLWHQSFPAGFWWNAFLYSPSDPIRTYDGVLRLISMGGNYLGVATGADRPAEGSSDPLSSGYYSNITETHGFMNVTIYNDVTYP